MPISTGPTREDWSHVARSSESDADVPLPRAAGPVGEVDIPVGGRECFRRHEAVACHPAASHRAAGEVVRQWVRESRWDARSDVYAQAAVVNASCRATTGPADVDAIVAAVLRGKENA
jgi:hypothetical protein